MVAAQGAGAHYDPQGSGHHGLPWGDGHLGDLPALYVAPDGTATYPVLAPAGAAEAKALVPDVSAQATFDNLKEGKDAAMEAILAHSSKRAAADAAK